MLTEREHDEPRLREYLLGGLSPGERLDLEGQYFDDDALFEALAALEEEIIRDYLRGGLRRAERARFEGRLAACSDLRRKVDVSRGVWRALAAGATGGGVSGWRLRAPPWLLAVTPLWRFATVVGVVCLCVGVVSLAVGVSRLRGRVAGLEAEIRRRSVPVLPVPSFVLLPGVTRSGETPANLLIISSESPEVALQLSPRREYGAAALSAVLRMVDRSGEVWGGAALVRGGLLEVKIPKTVLLPNDYILELREQPPHGTSQVLEAYAFSVRSRE